jgi:hypothetical protein
MVVENLVGVYVSSLLFGIPDIWLCSYPLLSSFMVKNIGFFLLQLFFDILNARLMTHCASPSTL